MGSKCDAAFKRETIRMIEQEGLGAAEVSARTGMHVKTLYRWLLEYREDDTTLNTRLGIHSGDSLTEAVEAIHTKQINVFHSLAFQAIKNTQP